MVARFLAGFVCLALSTAAGAATIYDYELNGSYADALGGPSLTGNGGTLGATGLTFGANQGPTLSASIGAVYTIETKFSFDTTSGYRKIISFANNNVDTGFYNLNTRLNFFNVATSSSIDFANGVQAVVALSRDAASTVRGYVNGTQVFSFVDTTNIANPGSALFFFQDDSATGAGEASSGFVDYIRIADTAGSSVSPIGGATVPEPATWALMIGGFGLVGASLRRRAAIAA